MNVTVALVDESKIGQKELLVALTVGESTTTLDATGLGQLIKLLAGARAQYPSEQNGATAINPAEFHVHITDPVVALAGSEAGHPPQMYIHHPGYGWVPFRISEAWVKQLNELYAQALAVKQPSIQ